jgi:hypothetical protein
MFNQLIQPYDEGKIEAIRVTLRNHAAIGEAITYKVVIDGEEVVPKTNDPELFNSVFELVHPDMRHIDYIRYAPNSRNRTVRRFIIQPTTSDAQLGNTSTGENAPKQSEYFAQQLRINQLEHENRSLTASARLVEQKLEVLFNKYHLLVEEHDELKRLHDDLSSQNQLVISVENLLGQFMGGKDKPSTGPLSGTTNEQGGEKTKQTTTAAPDYDQVAISQTDYKNFLFMNELMEPFTEMERGHVFHILEKLAADRHKIEQVLILMVTQ